MEMEFRRRNNDVGPCVPTFQERVNTMLPADGGATAAAEVIAPSKALMTPHMPNASEVQETLQLMEQEAERQSMEIVEMHSGLNEMRVQRLLGLLQ